MKNKRGLSAVIGAIILIALAVASVSIIWVVVKNMIEGNIEQTESCGVKNFDKVNINNEFTCYNYSSEEFRFSINIGDIEVDELLISISTEEETKSFRINEDGSSYPELRSYRGEYGSIIRPPVKDAGLTYVADMNKIGIGIPKSIKIAPSVDGKQCEVSDSLYEIDNCLALG